MNIEERIALLGDPERHLEFVRRKIELLNRGAEDLRRKMELAESIRAKARAIGMTGAK